MFTFKKSFSFLLLSIILILSFVAISSAGEKIKLTNGQIETVLNKNTVGGQQIWKILDNIKDQKQRFEAYKVVATIKLAKETEVYQTEKTRIVEKYNADQKLKPEKERKIASFDNIPELFALININSGLSIEKIEINNSQLSNDVTISDMSNADWLFIFK
jgi:hypothetical protein